MPPSLGRTSAFSDLETNHTGAHPSIDRCDTNQSAQFYELDEAFRFVTVNGGNHLYYD